MIIKFKSLFLGITFFICSYAISQELIEIKRIDSIAILFQSGKSEIENPTKIFNRINQKKIVSGNICLNSYTDTVGSISNNQKLAAKRIESVSKLLNTTYLKDFPINNLNENEHRNKSKTPRKSINDSLYRRVDLIIYSVENKFKYNEPINLNINFESGTDIISESSKNNLTSLKSILEKDSTIQIQLNGHVCCRNDYEMSLKRAEQVKKYLAKNGIQSSRIKCKGFGNSLRLVPDTTYENQKKNMRVDVIFTK